MSDQERREPYALTTKELAERWRISPRTLERWRHESRGPPWLVLGGRVVCRMQDVLAYERAHLQRPARETDHG